MLLHELALIKGELHVDVISSELSGWELARWQAFFEAKEKRRDKIELYLGRLTYILANQWGENMEIEDALFDWDNEKNQPEKIDQESLMYALAAAFGAKIIDNREKSNGN